MVKVAAKGSVRVSPALQHRNETKLEILWPRRAPDESHHRAVAAAAIHKLPQTGNDLQEDPTTWLRVIESDLRPLNIGPSYEWKKAASREH